MIYFQKNSDQCLLNYCDFFINVSLLCCKSADEYLDDTAFYLQCDGERCQVRNMTHPGMRNLFQKANITLHKSAAACSLTQQQLDAGNCHKIAHSIGRSHLLENEEEDLGKILQESHFNRLNSSDGCHTATYITLVYEKLKKYSKLSSEKIRAIMTLLAKMPRIQKRAFSSENIVSSWKITGVHPFDKEQIIKQIQPALDTLQVPASKVDEWNKHIYELHNIAIKDGEVSDANFDRLGFPIFQMEEISKLHTTWRNTGEATVGNDDGTDPNLNLYDDLLEQCKIYKMNNKLKGRPPCIVAEKSMAFRRSTIPTNNAMQLTVKKLITDKRLKRMEEEEKKEEEKRLKELEKEEKAKKQEEEKRQREIKKKAQEDQKKKREEEKAEIKKKRDEEKRKRELVKNQEKLKKTRCDFCKENIDEEQLNVVEKQKCKRCPNCYLYYCYKHGHILQDHLPICSKRQSK